MAMKTIPAGEFKQRCLRIMDEIKRHRESIVITKRGVPVAKLVPVSKPRRTALGCLRGKIEILGDLLEPVVAPEEWQTIQEWDELTR